MLAKEKIVEIIDTHLANGHELSQAVRKSVAPDHQYAPETIQLWHAIVYAEHLAEKLKAAPKASTR